MVVPDGVLFGDGVAARIKRDLLKSFNLHTIVRLPDGVFAPYTPIRTNLLFFDRTRATSEIWFYEQSAAGDRKNYTKTMPLRFEEFAECQAWWGGREREGRVENGRAWRVAVKQVMDNNCNLDLKNPTQRGEFAHLPAEQIVDDILSKERQIAELMGEVKRMLVNEPI